MTRDEMLLELRYVLNSAAGGTDWLDATLLGYLAEGQDTFCEDTGYFRDVSNYIITLQTGVATYAIDDRIIEILDIWDGTRKLEKLDTGEEFDVNITAGDPEKWRTDKETDILTFDREPTSDENGDEFTLHVWRYSEDALDDDGIDPEIPSRFHRACIEWAAYKAFNHHDIETQDPVKAADHLDIYNDYVLRGISAMRKKHNIETRVGTSPAYRT